MLLYVTGITRINREYSDNSKIVLVPDKYFLLKLPNLYRLSYSIRIVLRNVTLFRGINKYS